MKTNKRTNKIIDGLQKHAWRHSTLPKDFGKVKGEDFVSDYEIGYKRAMADVREITDNYKEKHWDDISIDALISEIQRYENK